MQMKTSSSSTSTKLKTLIHNLITHPVYRFVRALNKARSILLEASKHNSSSSSSNNNRVLMMFYPRKISKKQSKILFGSFRLHYNWCSSHVVPVPVPYPLHHNSLFDSEFSCEDAIVNGDNEDRDSQLSGYLEWLEEKVSTDDYVNGDHSNETIDNSNDNGEEKDIDRLADKFIASCHEKFLLEKVESYRRFQEMLARSL